MTRVFKKSRHIRWNWQESPDARDQDGNDSVRYHFVVVEDRNRKGIMNQILEGLAQYGGVTPVREVEGDVKDSKLKFLFCSYDTLIRPEKINWPNGKPLKMDRDLRERQRRNIEDYVRNKYE